MKAIRQFLWDMDFMSKLFVLLGVILLTPILIVLPYPHEAGSIGSFLYPAIFSILFGLLYSYRPKGEDRPKIFGRPHESVAVVGIWAYAILLGAMPFVLSGQLNLLGGIFEATSGWTTTGLSVMDLSTVNNTFMFYRGFMQFCGGLGFVLLMLVFASGSSAMELFSAEGHPDKLEPNLRSTAKLMMFIYVGSNILGTIAYMIFGLPWLDAVFHSMAALSTGGFGMTAESVAAYHSLPVEIITMILMLIGTTNFAILALLVKGKFKKFLQIGETWFMVVLIMIFVGLVSFGGMYGVYSNLSQSVRDAFFQVVSGLSTTGFSTVDFNKWTGGMNLVIIISMIIGGGAGSTAGGIKFTRVYGLYKNTVFNLKKRFMPERSVNMERICKVEGPTYLTYQSLEEMGRYFFAYISIYFIGVLMLSLGGIPLEKAMFEFSSALGTAGLSVGITGPGTSAYVLIIEIAGMFLGRLEIFIILTAALAILVKGIDLARGKRLR